MLWFKYNSLTLGKFTSYRMDQDLLNSNKGVNDKISSCLGWKIE